ncbi:MAG: DUF4276 family protein [Candidatus Delongbacteria bacterium]|nr:DUF4276 family protein [Candidatus Delongbacteria bacterium]
MNPTLINFVFEDQISEYVMRKIINRSNRYSIGSLYSKGGWGYIKKNIKRFNQASAQCPYFVLTDLDRGNCAPMLIDEWLGSKPNPQLIFRVAVREVEAWLLPDIEGFSRFAGVSQALLERNPESISDPKAMLFEIVKHSRKRSIKEDILPHDNYARVGPNYNGCLGVFVNEYWDIVRAADRSDSLRRTMDQIDLFNADISAPSM